MGKPLALSLWFASLVWISSASAQTELLTQDQLRDSVFISDWLQKPAWALPKRR